jgi:hypothetical protein
VSCAAHGGSQPDNGVESRWTRCSHLARHTSHAFRVRSSEALKNGAGCYPLRCGRVGCRFPEGQNPLQLDSPYHVSAKRSISGTHLPFTSPFRDMLLTFVERPTRLSPNGSLLPWQKKRSYEVSFFHSFHSTVFTAHASFRPTGRTSMKLVLIVQPRLAKIDSMVSAAPKMTRWVIPTIRRRW